MEQQYNSQLNKPVQGSKNIWIIAVSIIITGLVVGGGVFFWQNSAKQELINRIIVLEQQPESTSQGINGGSQNQLELCRNAKDDFQQQFNNCQRQLQVQQEINKKPQQEDLSIAQNTYIENGTVYYTDEKGKKIIVVQSINDPSDSVKDITYKKAELSPNKEFILLASIRWEAVSIEVFDISTGKIHKANASGFGFGEWLPDNKLKVVGECGMGISCGIYESIDSRAPWVLERIGDYK